MYNININTKPMTWYYKKRKCSQLQHVNLRLIMTSLTLFHTT